MKVLFIGGGNMGAAIAAGALSQSLVEPTDLTFVERNDERRTWLVSEYGALTTPSLEDVSLDDTDLVVIAVKPQHKDPVFDELKLKLNAESKCVVVSVMAGITLAQMESGLGGYGKLIRSMPNMPAQIREGVTVFTASKGVNEVEKSRASSLFSAVGVSFEVSDEKLLDAAVAMAGSGPGFLFYIVEHFLKISEELGFEPNQARDVVFHTLSGALNQWKQLNVAPADLRARVTSKGGTTEAGIGVFEKGGLGELLQQGVQAAYDRSIELSKD